LDAAGRHAAEHEDAGIREAPVVDQRFVDIDGVLGACEMPAPKLFEVAFQITRHPIIARVERSERRRIEERPHVVVA
jgi:hypothetical protein